MCLDLYNKIFGTFFKVNMNIINKYIKVNDDIFYKIAIKVIIKSVLYIIILYIKK